MNLVQELVQKVPDYKKFMTVDELNESSKRLKETYPDVVEFFEIGKSTSGEPIYCLKIAGGEKTALLYGFPHPNEPIGSVMLDYLSWRLAENKELRKMLGFTWYIVKAADVDGAKLNEGWFKKPYSFREYVYHYYRPAGNEQVEWSFPIEYKTLKFDKPTSETRALMEIIEKSSPSFIYSLHNAGFGGVYYYITEDAPILYPIFEKAVSDQDVPLSLGEPEVPYVKQLNQAVFLMPTVEDAYDYFEKYSKVDPATIIMSGESSYGYARRFNEKVFELVCEVPYYFDERVGNTNRIKVKRRKLVLEQLEFQKADMEELISLYERIKDKIDTHTKFQDALEYFMKSFRKSFDAELNWAQTVEELEREATVAEKFDNQISSKSYSLFKWGMFYRLLRSQKKGKQEFSKIASKVRERIDSHIEKLEKRTQFAVIPIKKLVQIQLMAGLYSCLYTSLRK
ncbi:MAG: M14 family zinc carboxypeptidase [Pseudothermotoga sp.]